MKNLFKRLAKSLLYRPRGVGLGTNSWIHFPREIPNRSLVTLGNNSFIRGFSVIHALSEYGGASENGRIEIGNDVYVGRFFQIHARNLIKIGDGCVLSEYVYISDLSHGLNPCRGLILNQPLESKGPVEIGKGVFVGYGASILPGVTLGDHSVVGTGSVVTKSVPPYCMVVGMPARIIKKFDRATGQWFPFDDVCRL